MSVRHDSIIAGFWRTKHWGMTPQELNTFINSLLELGIYKFDHAFVYRSEAPFGQALALSPELRKDIHIISKCGIVPPGDSHLHAKETAHYNSSEKLILTSVDHTLKDLQTDYIDTLLIHRPDYLMNVDEIGSAFNALKDSGKVKNFGVSNFNTHQFELLQSALDIKLCTNQIEFSPFETSALDNGLLDQCYRHKIQPMLWSCLGGGQLFDESNPITQRLLKALAEIKEETNAPSTTALIYAWILKLPSAPQIISGSSKIENTKPLVDALNIELSQEHWYKILKAARGYDIK